MIHRSLTAVAALSLLVAAAAAKDYEIRFSRPDTVGKKYRLTAEFSKQNLMTVSKGGNVLQKKNDTVEATLQAVVTIDKVDKEGHALAKTVTIEKFVDDTETVLLKKGTVVTAQTLEGKTIYRIGDKPLEKKTRDILGDIIKTRTRKSLDDDEVFGSKKRRKVGESWPMNAKAAIKDLKATMKMEVEGVSGTVKLQGVETCQGQECLNIRVKMKIDKIKSLPDSEAFEKQGLKLQSADLQIKLGGLLPVDVKGDAPKRDMSMTMNMTIVGVKGAVTGIEMKITTKMSAKETYAVLK